MKKQTFLLFMLVFILLGIGYGVFLVTSERQMSQDSNILPNIESMVLPKQDTPDVVNSNINIENIDLLVFQKPNLDWKSRDIALVDGRILHYVFGEGNPMEVGLTDSEKNTYIHCNPEESLRITSCGSIGHEVFGYVTPDVEKDLLALIGHPKLEHILRECRIQFEMSEYPVIQSDDASYARVISDGWMDMENMMDVSDQNGRKFLSNRLKSFMGWFQNSLVERKEIFGRDIFREDNCITRNGGMEIYRLMDAVSMKMFYPLGNYPVRLTDTGSYVPWY